MVCGICRTLNRAEGGHCRACRRELVRDANRFGRANPEEADFLFVQGGFRQPPVAWGEFLWLISTSGTLFRLAPRRNAKAWAISTIDVKDHVGGFNRFRAVDIQDSGSALKGPCIITADPRAVHAVSLLTGRWRALYDSRPEAEIAANAIEAESTAFKGVAVAEDCYIFATRSGAQGFSLNIRYFSPERAMEQPGTVKGRNLIGPAKCGENIGLATEEEIYIYNRREQKSSSFAMPRAFSPLFSRSSEDLNVAPGGMSLVVSSSGAGREAWVGGTQNGRPGLLYVHFDRQFSEFEALPVGSCITTNDAGVMAINTVDTIRFIAGDRPSGRFSKLQPGMPVSYSRLYLGYFERETVPGEHVIHLHYGSQPIQMHFDDRQCNEDSCCGMDCFGSDAVVSYLDLSKRGVTPGVRIAHWRLAV